MTVPDPQAFPLLLATLAAFTVGLSKGGLPMIGAMAVPLLALRMNPVAAAAILLPVFVLSDVVSVWLYRRDFSRRHLAILIPPALVGVLLGWRFAAQLPTRWIGLMIGVIGLGFCLWMLVGARLVARSQPAPAAIGQGWSWGVVTGFTSFVAHAGAPPYQIYMLPQRLPKMTYAGTSTLFFAVVNLAKVPPYLQLSPFSAADWRHVAWMTPAALLGTLVGAWATRRLNERWFYRLVQGSLLLVSLKLVADAVAPR